MTARFCLAFLFCLAALSRSAAAAEAWRPLAAGVEYAELHPDGAPADRFHIVRIDPARARLRAVMATALDRKPRTAAAWCDEQHLLAAINLGMFLDDRLSNVGHAEAGGHVNQRRWVKKYQSVLALYPRRPGLPAAALVDLDAPGAQARLADYGTVIQNLRLIRSPGHNAWGPQPRKWSEAAVALDQKGRVLFVFARTPHSMFEFNQALLALPLGVTAAMHVEGGPEASLSVRGPLKLNLNGSFETGFVENDSVAEQWPIPNVLGVEASR